MDQEERRPRSVTIESHPWARPLTPNELESLEITVDLVETTHALVRRWCLDEMQWAPLPGSPCFVAMNERSYLRSDRRTAWGDGPFEAMNAECKRSVIVATDLLRAVAALCRAGASAGQSHLPLIRASFERSATVIWILDEDLDPRQRYARSVLERISGCDHAVDSAPDREMRAEYKSTRRKLRNALHELFNGVSDTKESGRATDLTVADQRQVSPTARAEDLARRAVDQPNPIKVMYPTLSFFTHSNTSADVLWIEEPIESGEPFLKADVTLLTRAVLNAKMTLGTALHHVSDWMGWPSEELDNWHSYVVPGWKRIQDLAGPQPPGQV